MRTSTHSALKVMVATTILAGCGSSAIAQNLVHNGGFETGDLTDWTVGNSSDPYVYVAYNYDGYHPLFGNYQLILGSTNTDTISQTLSTVQGTTYELSYWLAGHYGGGNNQFGVSINGSSVNSLTVTNIYDLPYTQYTYDFTASSSKTLLSFAEVNRPGAFLLDNISVASATPEPSAYLAFSMGLGLLGLARRFKRS